MDSEAEQVGEGDDRDDHEQGVETVPAHELPVEQSGDHENGAMREVDDPKHSEQEAQAYGEPAVNATEQRPVDEGLKEVEKSHEGIRFTG